MRILLTGATGFIGRHLAKSLIAAGHEVSGTSRNRNKAFRRYPGMGWIKADFAADRNPIDWERRLTWRDEVVINAAGILRERPGESFEAVHFEGPRALFRACARRGIRKVIHVSALGCDINSSRPYEETKLRIERFLATLDMDWVVVRPSLVYGEDSPSSKLFRFLAGLPVMPLIGDGSQRLQPIHVDDLAAAIVGLTAPGSPSRTILELGGPRPVTYKELLAGLRAGNYGAPVRYLEVPLPLVRAGARVADLIGHGPIGMDTLSMLMRGNVTERNAAALLLGRDPRSVTEAPRAAPAGTARIEAKVS